MFEPNSHPMRLRLPDPKTNILIDNNGHACLTDIGLVGIFLDQGFCRSYLSSLIRDGRLQWASPELSAVCGESEHYHPTEESDCYALGMVAYEVLSGKTPFAQDPFEVMREKVLNGERPPNRSQWWGGKLITDDIWNTLEHCWAHCPGDRMNASEILLCLEGHPVPIGAILERGAIWRYEHGRRWEERRASIMIVGNYFDLVDD